MQARLLLSIASKSTPFSLRAFSSYSVSASANPRLHNHFTDEEEEGYSPVYSHALKFQRPPTVSLRRHVLQSNSASFIGTVCVPPKIITTLDDELGVRAILDVKPSPESKTTLRISLKMWNSMAEIFLGHSSCNDFIYVAGRLDCYTEPIENGAPRTHYEVKVRELNFVTPRRQDPTKSEEFQPQKGEAGLEEYKNGLHLWKVFFANPSEWLDARNTKNGSSQPDFIHKDTGKALWQWPNDPPWIEERLQLLEAGLEKYRDDIHLWQVFFASPDDWWDNRKNKRNPRAPDFKHKDTGEALWISPDDPPWIRKQLESLDLQMANQCQSEAGLETCRDDTDLWQVFFASPDEWWNYRKNKKSPRHPDFKHKDTGEALWISPDDPPWIKKQLESLDLQMANQGQGEAGLDKYNENIHLWQVFFASPDDWWDNRKDKRNPRAPDFKHKDTDEALWQNPDDPPWIKKQLESLDLRRAKQGLGEHGGGSRSRVFLYEFDQ